MRRREFILLVGGAALAGPGIVHGQITGKQSARVGVLWHAGSAEEEGTNFKALVKGFADLGSAEGRSITLEHRFPSERADRFRSMASELVESKVDVLVAIGANSAPYAKAATSTVPVVFALVPDPLGANLVKSLARPEANITGFSNSASDLIGKRLGLLKEVIPGLSKVALLVNTNSPLASGYETAVNNAASGLGLTGAASKWKSPDELKPTFAAMKAAGIQAVMFNPDGWAFTYRDLISKLALESRLPLSAYSRQTLAAGALMSYGVDHDAILYRVAIYVSKILKGVKVEELPIEQPTKFEFLINLKTAKALELAIPPSMLLRADEVVE